MNSCTNPYQTPHSLNPSPLFNENPFFFTEKCCDPGGLGEGVDLPKRAKLPGSGAKILLGLRGKSQGKSLSHWCKPFFAPVQPFFRTSARDFFLFFAPEAQKNFSTTSWQLCPFGRSTPSPRPPGSQEKCFVGSPAQKIGSENISFVPTSFWRRAATRQCLMSLVLGRQILGYSWCRLKGSGRGTVGKCAGPKSQRAQRSKKIRDFDRD